jgi:phytoene dehydrogenase-like protein
VPVGGSGALIDALVTRLRAAGGEIRCGVGVRELEITDGKVRGVRTADGERFETTTVLADVSAPMLYGQLIGRQHLPPRLLDDLRRFQWDSPTMKIDWALSAGVPWTAKDARGAGTVHLGVDLDGLTRYAGDLATGTVPRSPFLVMGQMTTSDPTRSPAGTESAWAYTHLPQGEPMRSAAVARQVKRVEAVIEARAPGFVDTIQARRVLAPSDLERLDANLTDGAVAGGTASIHQQLIFRPVPGLARAETPIDGVYLASASAHPGGGVHGAPGSNAALAALHRTSWTGGLRRWALDAAQRRIYR